MTREQGRKDIRKYRKKLRQIENLERKTRELNDEEIEKVLKKDKIRSWLQDLLKEYPDDDDSVVSNNSTQNITVSSSSSYPSSPLPPSPSTPQYEEEEEYEKNRQEEYDDQEYEYEDNCEQEAGSEEHEDDEEEEDVEPDVQEQTRHEEKVKKNITSSQDSSRARIETRGTGDSQPQSVPHKKIVAAPKVEEKAARGTQADSSPPRKTAAKTKAKTKDDKSKECRKLRFNVEDCVGHNDLVCSVALDGDIMVTGSRDTTVKIWNVETGQERRSLAGHSMCVASVLLLSPQQSTALLSAAAAEEERDDGLIPGDRVVISGSHDCHIKIWSIETGLQVKSMYTYNPVTSLAFTGAPHNLIVSGSDGGKLEVWDALEGKMIQSIRNEEEVAITALQYSGDHLYVASADGLLRVYQQRDSQLNPVYVSENARLEGEGDNKAAQLLKRRIRCMSTAGSERLYYGDDGLNVKVLDWRQGKVHKLANHIGEYGSTDALCLGNDMILSSGFDLDTGMGYVNFRSVADEHYIASVCDEDASRIVAMAASTTQDGRFRYATAGMELKLWTQAPLSDQSPGLVSSYYLAAYTRPARHSDVETDEEAAAEWTDSDASVHTDADTPAPFRRPTDTQDVDTQGGWTAWCTVL